MPCGILARVHYRVQETCEGIDWTLVREVLKAVEMGYHTPELHQQAFRNSFAVVFVFDGDEMAGFGRALSDGAYQAAVYDVAVRPECQGKGVGKLVMTQLLQKISHCNVILYASPGKEAFYAKWGFAPLKTGMGLFRNPERMRERNML